MLWFLYNLLFPVVFVCMLPKFIFRMVRRGGYGRHFSQRLGFFDGGTTVRLREHRRIWVHAVSVGEVYVALRFIKAYRQANPASFFALSTTTSTGHALAVRELDSRDVLFYFPVDLPPIVGKVLRLVDPVRMVLVEAEFWPNLIRMADRMGIPVSLINGRVSRSSYRGYRKLKPLTADVLRRIDPICMQGPEDAERMVGIGAPPENVHVMGTVKFDVAERDPAGEQIVQDLMHTVGVDGESLVLLGGSTWPGEEEALCRIFKQLASRWPGLFLVLVPRHAERVEEVARMLDAQGISYLRRSRIGSSKCIERPDVLLVDSTGELIYFYSIADVIFMGKSLFEHGGQNPIEPAMYGKAVVAGPNMENFPVVMEAFLRNDAMVQVASPDELERVLDRLLGNPVERNAIGARAREVVEANRGVIERTVEQLGFE